MPTNQKPEDINCVNIIVIMRIQIKPFLLVNYKKSNSGPGRGAYSLQLTSSHLLLEHLDHVVVGAGSRDLAQQAVELRLAHEDTNVVEGTTEVIFVELAILVDVHELEAVLVHLQLLLGESALILTPGGRIWLNCYVMALDSASVFCENMSGRFDLATVKQ